MSILDAAGLPEQFGFLLLAIATILLLSPYLSGSDLGMIKIPNLSEGAKKSLKLGGPIAMLAVIVLHVNMLPKVVSEEKPEPVTADVLEPTDSDLSSDEDVSENSSAARCSVSGTVFDRNTNEPISALLVGVQSDTGKTPRPVPLARHLATTGPDGRFVFQCDWIEAEQFPIRISVSHRDWVATHLGPKIKESGKWDGINFPIDLAKVTLKEKPMPEIGVSFRMRFRDDTRTVVYGEVKNKSEKRFACVKVTFELRKDGERSGTQDVIVRNLKALENRVYEAEFPPNVDFRLLSKKEC